MRYFGVLAVALLAFGCHADKTEAPAVADETPLYYNVGGVSKTITTTSPEAQAWFDRGLGLAYGFNHEEAIKCFERAAEIDPTCAMCYWGKSYALGPNYNDTEMTDEKNVGAYEAIEQAVVHLDGVTDVERGLIEALQTRYAMPAPEDRMALEQAYADSMRALWERFPEDPDVTALAAEASMMLVPWQLWSHDGIPAPQTLGIRAMLEQGMELAPNHPALNHLYIHTMEAGPAAVEAVPAAERLEQWKSGLGHLIHMPSHIYVWTGRYDDVIRTNREAVEVDGVFVEHAGRENFYTLYRLHNYHFVAYGAMFAGRKELALEYSRELVTELPDSLLAAFPDFLDVFTATPYHVMVRFGMWDELLEEPRPAAEEQHAARAVWHYARGIALASLGRVDPAVAEQKAFRDAWKLVPETRLLFQNPVQEILNVADAVLAGEVEYRKGNYDVAFKHLHRAVDLDQRLNYDEPWGWMEPARHALGALLTEQKRYEEAVTVYEANLDRYPENGWALHGLAESLRGLGRDDEAASVEQRFNAAFKDADIVIPGSCYCRTKA